MTRLPLTVLLVALAAAALAQPPALDLVTTVEGDGDDMLYRPDALCFGPDGSRYVLNAGDCRVLRFDADWSLIGAFGREGEGPGEFTNPTGMIIRHDQIWVFEMMRATLFTMDGAYVETRTSRLEMHEPVGCDRGVLVRLGSNDRLAALLDDDLALIEKLGPDCPSDGDFMKQYRTCGFVHALPHPDHLALLLNPFDGHLWVLDREGAVVAERDLVGESGRSNAQHDEDEGTVTMSFSLVMGTGGVDRLGRFWTLPMSPDAGEDEDAPQLVVVLGRDLEPLAEFTLPDDVGAFRIYQAPGGNLVLLDGNASLIHECAYPEGLGTD